MFLTINNDYFLTELIDSFTVVSMYASVLTKNLILSTLYGCVFHNILTIKEDIFLKQHNGCKGGAVCFLQGKNSVFVYYLDELQASKV
jgi:hypothetical protein